MLTQRTASLLSLVPRRIALAAVLVLLGSFNGNAQTVATNLDQAYEHKETHELVALVDDA